MTTKSQEDRAIYYLDLYRGLHSLTPELGPLHAHTLRNALKKIEPSLVTPHLHTCRECGATHILKYSLSEFLHWRKGVGIAISMPNVDTFQRSLLLNGICSECTEKIALD